MSVAVEFIGGSAGGQTRVYEKYPGPRIVLPAYVRPRAVITGDTVPLPMPRYAKETYVVDGRGYDNKRLRYRWERPDIEGMQAEIARLKRELEEATRPQPRKGLMRFGRGVE